MTEIYVTISLSTHNGDDTPQNYVTTSIKIHSCANKLKKNAHRLEVTQDKWLEHDMMNVKDVKD